MTLIKEKLATAFSAESIRHHFAGIPNEMSDEMVVASYDNCEEVDDCLELGWTPVSSFENDSISEIDEAIDSMKTSFMMAYERAAA